MCGNVNRYHGCVGSSWWCHGALLIWHSVFIHYFLNTIQWDWGWRNLSAQCLLSQWHKGRQDRCCWDLPTQHTEWVSPLSNQISSDFSLWPNLHLHEEQGKWTTFLVKVLLPWWMNSGKMGKYAKLEDLCKLHLTSGADVSKKRILECLYLGSAQGEFFLSPEYATSIWQTAGEERLALKSTAQCFN